MGRLYDTLQLVRETKMAAQIRPSSSRTATQQAVTSSSSTIPAWLADDDCKPSPRSSAAAQRSDGPVSCLYSRSGRSKGARLGSAVPPSYHKLSLELIKSMSDKGEHQLCARNHVCRQQTMYCNRVPISCTPVCYSASLKQCVYQVACDFDSTNVAPLSTDITLPSPLPPPPSGAGRAPLPPLSYMIS